MFYANIMNNQNRFKDQDNLFSSFHACLFEAGLSVLAPTLEEADDLIGSTKRLKRNKTKHGVNYHNNTLQPIDELSVVEKFKSSTINENTAPIRISRRSRRKTNEFQTTGAASSNISNDSNDSDNNLFKNPKSLTRPKKSLRIANKGLSSICQDESVQLNALEPSKKRAKTNDDDNSPDHQSHGTALSPVREESKLSMVEPSIVGNQINPDQENAGNIEHEMSNPVPICPLLPVKALEEISQNNQDKPGPENTVDCIILEEPAPQKTRTKRTKTRTKKKDPPVIPEHNITFTVAVKSSEIIESASCRPGTSNANESNIILNSLSPIIDNSESALSGNAKREQLKTGEHPACSELNTTLTHEVSNKDNDEEVKVATVISSTAIIERSTTQFSGKDDVAVVHPVYRSTRSKTVTNPTHQFVDSDDVSKQNKMNCVNNAPVEGQRMTRTKAKEAQEKKDKETVAIFTAESNEKENIKINLINVPKTCSDSSSAVNSGTPYKTSLVQKKLNVMYHVLSSTSKPGKGVGDEPKSKREEKMQKAMEKKLAAEKQKLQHLKMLQQQKQEKEKLAKAERLKRAQEAALKKKMLNLKLQNAEERRLKEEKERIARLKKQEEEQKRIAQQRQKEIKEAALLRIQQQAEAHKRKVLEAAMKQTPALHKGVPPKTVGPISHHPPKEEEVSINLSDFECSDSEGEQTEKKKKSYPSWTSEFVLNPILGNSVWCNRQIWTTSFPLNANPIARNLFDQSLCKERGSSVFWGSPSTSHNSD